MTPANVTEMIGAILNADEVSASSRAWSGNGRRETRSCSRRCCARPSTAARSCGRRTAGAEARSRRCECRRPCARPCSCAWDGSTPSGSRFSGPPPCSDVRSTTHCSSRWPRPTRARCSPRSSRRSRSSCSRRRPRPASATSGATRSHRRRSRATRSSRSGSGSTPVPPTRSCAPTGALAVARHLLAAGRTEEAVDACLRAADEAERAIAFSEAAELLERVLPHVTDGHERASLLARMGHLRWLNGEPTAGEQLLADGVGQLDELGEDIEAARARIHLGRCRWELDQPDAAYRDFQGARDVLEKEGPSPELALAYLRIAGIHAFQLDYGACLAAAERAAEIAELASADFERVWSSPMSPSGTSAPRTSSRSSTAATRRPWRRVTGSSPATRSTTRSGTASTRSPVAWAARWRSWSTSPRRRG